MELLSPTENLDLLNVAADRYGLDREALEAAARSAPLCMKVSSCFHAGMGHGAHGTSLDVATAAAVAERMQALASPGRLLILDRLRAGAWCVSDLAEALGMEQSAVSHQLRLLRHLDLVVSARRGRRVFYGLHDVHVAELIDQAIAHAEHLALRTPDPVPMPERIG